MSAMSYTVPELFGMHFTGPGIHHLEKQIWSSTYSYFMCEKGSHKCSCKCSCAVPVTYTINPMQLTLITTNA